MYMDNYLTLLNKVQFRYKGSHESFPLMSLIPNKLCPFALHSLAPYIYTLRNGGWFRWVKKTENTNYRIPLGNMDYNCGSINYSFDNEVLVQCPNSKGAVVFGVGPKTTSTKKSILIRVHCIKGDCIKKYEKGDKIFIEEGQIGDIYLFSQLFPYALSIVMGGGLPASGSGTSLNGPNGIRILGDEMDKYVYLSLNGNEVLNVVSCGNLLLAKTGSITLSRLKSPCRFHNGIESIKFEDFSHNDFCLFALHASYISAIALAYGSFDKIQGHSFLCPSLDCKVKFCARRKYYYHPVLIPILKIFAKINGRLRRPLDILYWDVKLKIESVEGKCPMGHYKGYETKLNLFCTTKLCPATFHAVFPYLFLQAQGLPFPWHSEQDVLSTVSCPDCAGADYFFEKSE